MPTLNRHILDETKQTQAVAILQKCLYNLIDLALQGKQAHWNVEGPNFRSIHLQLDEITESVRLASDEIAQRIVTLAASADGRAAELGKNTQLGDYPKGLKSVPETVTPVADRLEKTISGLRIGIEKLDKIDLICQDMLIAASATLEKHLWMIQAQEAST